jgi:integrase
MGAKVREGGIGDLRVYKQVLGSDGKWKSAPAGARKVDRWKLGREIWPEGDAKPKILYRFGKIREHVERDLDNAVADAMGDRSKDGITGDSSLAEALHAYRAVVLPTLKTSTRQEYVRDLDRGLIDPKVLGRKLSSLDKVVLTKELQRIARKHGHCVRHVRSMISAAFDLSSIANPVRSIPTKALELPDPEEVLPLSVEERDTVILTAKSRATFVGTTRTGVKASTKEKLRSVYEVTVFGFGTGVRIGEALALKWESVDLGNGLIRIVDGGSDGSTKTRAGVRTIPMTPDVRKLLEDRQRRLGGRGFVFGSPVSTLKAWDAHNLREDLRDLREAAGVQSFHFHSCRHTFAVTALAAGVDTYSVAQWLGHADPSITLRVYSKFIPHRDLTHVMSAIPGMAV